MKTFFTADTHFGHANIIKYCKRPFNSADEMNRTLITNWNAVVQPHDTVYHLGDFAVGGGPAEPYFDQLNGNIHLLIGNHENRARQLHSSRSLSGTGKNFISVSDLKEVTVDGQRIVLCHYAMKVWHRSHHGSWQLYGHSHGTLPDDPNSLSLDIGVDCWNYFPITLTQIREKMLAKTFRPVDHHNPSTT